MVDLTSPTEDETTDNNNDILFIKDTDTQKEGETEKKDEKVQEHEKHENLEGRQQRWNTTENLEKIRSSTGTIKLKTQKGPRGL